MSKKVTIQSDKMPKILFWDIETTNLNANFGIVLTAAWKWQGNPKVYHSTIADHKNWHKDRTNDRYVVEKMADAIQSADIIVTWYGARFDYPYIQSRLLYHKLPPMPPVPHIDGWRIAKYQMKMNSNRLQSVTSFLELEDKTPIRPGDWIAAMCGDTKALKYVLEHNRQDVIVLEQVYDRIKVLCVDHPNVNLITGKRDACPKCASTRINYRGDYITKTSKKPRFQCLDCRSWCQGQAERSNIKIR